MTLLFKTTQGIVDVSKASLNILYSDMTSYLGVHIACCASALAMRVEVQQTIRVESDFLPKTGPYKLIGNLLCLLVRYRGCVGVEQETDPITRGSYMTLNAMKVLP